MGRSEAPGPQPDQGSLEDAPDDAGTAGPAHACSDAAFDAREESGEGHPQLGWSTTSWQLLFQAHPEAKLLIAADGQILDINTATLQLLGCSEPAPLMACRLDDLCPAPADGEPVTSAATANARQHALAAGRCQLNGRCQRLDDGSLRSISLQLDRLETAAAEPLLLVSIEPLEGREPDRDRQQWLATTDSLTSLPNRQGALHWLQLHLQRSEPPPLLLLALDLDRFQWINNTFGVEQADELLTAFAQALRDQIPAAEQFARLQSDTFLAIVPLSPSTDAGGLEATCRQLIDKIRTNLSQQLQLQQSDLATVPTFCIGSSIYPVHAGNFYDSAAITAADLLQEVNTALSEARRQGISSDSHYSPHLSQAIQARLQLEARMAVAIQEGGFTLHYQPIVQRDGRIVGAEALMRWPQPGGGFVPPDQFIPLAEKNGQIRELGSWLIERACAQLADWRRSGLGLDYLSLNVSPVQLRGTDRSLLRQLSDAIARHQLPAAALQLEITETAVLDTLEATHTELRQLAACGISLALDDFGTGYSSLLTLRQLPLQALKIDKSFVQTMERDSKSLALVEVCLAIAAKLGLRCLAEGVETERQCQMLMRMGCDFYQGYLFDKPLVSDAFAQRLQRQQQALASSAGRR